MVFETQLQANTGMDYAFLMKGFEFATERNNGVPPEHQPPVSVQQGSGALLVGVLGEYTGEIEWLRCALALLIVPSSDS